MKYKQLTATSLLFCCLAVVTAQESLTTPEPTQNQRSLPPVSPLPLSVDSLGFFGDDSVPPPTAIPAGTTPAGAAGLSPIADDLAPNRQPEISTPTPPALLHKQEPFGSDGVNLQDFSCIEYRGKPLNIHFTGNDRSLSKVVVSTTFGSAPVQQSATPQWFSEIKRTPQGDIGCFPSEAASAAPESPNNPLLLLCEDGFKITTAKTLLKSGTTTKLNRFSNVKGTVKFAGPTDLHGDEIGVQKPGFVMGQTYFFVVAQWESIPFHLELTSQPAEKLKKGPGLFRVFMTSPLSFEKQRPAGFDSDMGDPSEEFRPMPVKTTQQFEASFEAKVPAGRIQFSIVKGDPADTSAWEPTGISWWETVGRGNSEDTVQELTSPTFELSVVKGQIKQTNKLLESLTTVKQVDGRIEVGQAQLQVMFEIPNFLTHITEDSSIEDLIRTSAIWGRPGGLRETSGYQVAINSIDADGAFTCVIPTPLLKSCVVSILKERAVLARDVARVPTASDRPFSDASARLSSGDPVFERASTRRQLGFSEIDLDPFLDAAKQTDPGLQRNPEEDSAAQPELMDQPLGKVDLAPIRSSSRDRDRGDRDALQQALVEYGTSPSIPVAPAHVKPVAQQVPSPIDRTIADLVARLLSSGDRRARQTMKEPLKQLLQQRFDAEQKAREQLLNELRKRFDKANEQVTERATRRDAIISEQLQRMLSLPEDDFEVLPDPNDNRNREIDRGSRDTFKRNSPSSGGMFGEEELF